MNPSPCPAARRPEVNRKDLAARHDVSRKFVHQQANKASAALDEVFASSAPDAAEHRDADTWGVHLLDAARQGLNPDYTIADAGQGLRAGQKARTRRS